MNEWMNEMLFSSWASWAGDWQRRPGMFELLRFCSNGSPLRCNDSTLFCCMMVSLTMTGQSRANFQTLLTSSNFWDSRGFPLVKIIIIAGAKIIIIIINCSPDLILILIFLFVFNPRDLYYRGYKIIIIIIIYYYPNRDEIYRNPGSKNP